MTMSASAQLCKGGTSYVSQEIQHTTNIIKDKNHLIITVAAEKRFNIHSY